MEKTLKELCLENVRKFEEERIQKEYDKEKEYLKTCYENNKDKIEQIREIIIAFSLEGKMCGEFSIPMMVIQNNNDSEFMKIYNYFDSIGVNLSIVGKFNKVQDNRGIGEEVNLFKYEFQNV